MPLNDVSPRPERLTVRCRFFARYAELLEREVYTLTLDAPATVVDAVAALRAELPAAERLPARPLTARNREHVPPEQPLADGDELAFLPPLAGG